MRGMVVEYMLLKYGLNYLPASLNIIAKRIGITESEKNLGILREELEKLVKKDKAFRSGNRYAIDAAGAKAVFDFVNGTTDGFPTPKDFQKTFREYTRQR